MKVNRKCMEGKNNWIVNNTLMKTSYLNLYNKYSYLNKSSFIHETSFLQLPNKKQMVMKDC